jgi:hypothetical protein
VEPPIIGPIQAANFGSLISTESRRLSPEISCHDITEPLATNCRSASIVPEVESLPANGSGQRFTARDYHTTGADLYHGLKTLCSAISMSLFVPLLEFNRLGCSHAFTTYAYGAWRSRITFLSSFPTLVLGKVFTKTIRSGTL